MTKTRRLFRVGDRGSSTRWICADLGDDGFVAYIQPTGAFQYHHPLQTDYYTAQECDYEPISAEQALAAIKDGAGKIDGRRHGDFVQELVDDPRRWAVEDVIPETSSEETSLRVDKADR